MGDDDDVQDDDDNVIAAADIDAADDVHGGDDDDSGHWSFYFEFDLNYASFKNKLKCDTFLIICKFHVLLF